MGQLRNALSGDDQRSGSSRATRISGNLRRRIAEGRIATRQEPGLLRSLVTLRRLVIVEQALTMPVRLT